MAPPERLGTGEARKNLPPSMPRPWDRKKKVQPSPIGGSPRFFPIFPRCCCFFPPIFLLFPFRWHQLGALNQHFTLMNDDQCPGAGVLASIESCSAACNKGIQNKQEASAKIWVEKWQNKQKTGKTVGRSTKKIKEEKKWRQDNR